jgi:hypothetical protein
VLFHTCLAFVSCLIDATQSIGNLRDSQAREHLEAAGATARRIILPAIIPAFSCIWAVEAILHIYENHADVDQHDVMDKKVTAHFCKQ